MKPDLQIYSKFKIVITQKVIQDFVSTNKNFVPPTPSSKF